MQRKSSEKGWNTMKDYNDTEFDKAVKSAVAPVFEADAELNRKVMYAAVVGKKSEKEKKRAFALRPGTVAALIGAVVLCSAGVYAATRLMKPQETEHAIFVGNSEYVDDEAIATLDPTEPVSPGYETTRETYDTYEEGLEATGFGIGFSQDYELCETVGVSVTTGPDNYRNTSLNAWFRYGENGVFNVYSDKSEGNIAEDAAYVVPVPNKTNVREYTSPNGETFVLADGSTDGVTKTYVLIAYDSARGVITFQDMSDDEIHAVLDSVELR